MGRKAQYKENNIFDYIIKYKTENDGLSPSYREMCSALGIHSVSTIHYYIKKLKSQGRIEVEAKRRWIKVIGGEWRYKK